jgi:hypothetical protein
MLAKVSGVLLAAGLAGVGTAVAQTQESEPNNTPATATTAVRGSTGRGTIAGTPLGADSGDTDYWVLTATAGDTIHVDVDADEFGSQVNTHLTLYASDGVTVLAVNAEWDGMDPHLMYVATASGPYYVAVQTEYLHWPLSDSPYTINFFEVKCPTADDVEPNDSPATATRVTLGQTVHGVSCPNPDRDFFKVDLTAGTIVELVLETPPHERITFGSANEIGGWIALLGPDGTTVLEQTNQEMKPDRIEYTIANTGTYFVSASVWPGGIRYTYTLSFRLLEQGAGDPITVRVEGLGRARGVAVNQRGEVFVSAGERSLWRVSLDGQKTLVTTAIAGPEGLGWDAFGNLLVSSSFDGVYRVSPSGEIARFIAETGTGWMTVAHDGTLWLSGMESRTLSHYDPFGQLLARFDVSAVLPNAPYQIAIAPSGEVHFTDFQAIYRLVGGHPQLVLRHEPGIMGLAFDIEGNIYVSKVDGTISLYRGDGTPLADPFARTPTSPGWLAFGRNADGSTNARLFVVNNDGTLVELNPGGIRAPGAPVGYATSAEAVADLLRSGGVLGDAERAFLDAVGNRNGRYDVGDLRAFLLLTGSLSPSSRRGPATP